MVVAASVAGSWSTLHGPLLSRCGPGLALDQAMTSTCAPSSGSPHEPSVLLRSPPEWTAEDRETASARLLARRDAVRAWALLEDFLRLVRASASFSACLPAEECGWWPCVHSFLLLS